jgi:hypothetical protein
MTITFVRFAERCVTAAAAAAESGAMADDLAEKRAKAKRSYASFMEMINQQVTIGDAAAATAAAAASSSAPKRRVRSPDAAPRIKEEQEDPEPGPQSRSGSRASDESKWYSDHNRSPTEEPSEDEEWPMQAPVEEEAKSRSRSSSAIEGAIAAAPWHQPQACLCGDNHPFGYGDWSDWNDPVNIALELQIAETHGMKNSQRGPDPEHADSPTVWNQIPFNQRTKSWLFETRAELPREYSVFTDWWTAEGLIAESALARKYMIPWKLRGPPTGPTARSPKSWRGMAWRPNAKKWMSRGGAGNT